MSLFKILYEAAITDMTICKDVEYTKWLFKKITMNELSNEDAEQILNEYSRQSNNTKRG